jgi:ABC-2 type transport system ATP-binding protein
MTESIIHIENLTRDFESVRAVDNISIDIPAGIVFGFLGPNGSGKTTTIRLLLGLLEPTQGQATVLGFDTRTQGDEIRTRTGSLLEHSGLYERLSAEENLEYFGRIYRLSQADRQARIKELLTNLELWDRRKEPLREWSRGMKQKIAVARAMLHHPQLIFLDEPTAGFDPIAAAALRDDLAALVAREGITVFLTTHNLAEAEKLCTEVGVIREGQLLAVGSPDQLRARAGGPQAEIIGHGFTAELVAQLRSRSEVANIAQHNDHLTIDLKPGITDIAPLISNLVGGGAQIEEVRKGTASLEEAFLTLMKEDKEQHD